MQLGHQGRVPIRKGRCSARNKRPVASKSDESDRRQPGLQADHPRLLRGQHARRRTVNLGQALGEQGPGYANIRADTQGVHVVHAEQQVLRVRQGVRGEQPEGGRGDPVWMRPRDRLGQLRPPVLRRPELGGLRGVCPREGHPEPQEHPRLDLGDEVRRDAAPGAAGKEAFHLA